jgi:hypothetical protein
MEFLLPIYYTWLVQSMRVIYRLFNCNLSMISFPIYNTPWPTINIYRITLYVCVCVCVCVYQILTSIIFLCIFSFINNIPVVNCCYLPKSIQPITRALANWNFDECIVGTCIRLLEHQEVLHSFPNIGINFHPGLSNSMLKIYDIQYALMEKFESPSQVTYHFKHNKYRYENTKIDKISCSDLRWVQFWIVEAMLSKIIFHSSIMPKRITFFYWLILLYRNSLPTQATKAVGSSYIKCKRILYILGP